MTTPSEHWVVSALRQATDSMPLPPESRWIRERRSTPRVSTIAVVAAAILTVAVGIAVGARRVEPRLVPAAGPSAFAVEEDRAWRIARALVPSDLVLLRPTWIPSEFRGSGSPSCPLPSAFVPGNNYSVTYSGLLPGRCAYFTLWGQLGTQDDTDQPDGLIETSTFNARGTTVHVRSGIPRTNSDAQPQLPQIHLWWNESGAHYDVIYPIVTTGDELTDLVRIVNSLEPVR